MILENSKEDVHEQETIEFEGLQYPIRRLCTDGYLSGAVISIESLHSKILNSEGSNYVSDEAARVDSQILFYVPEEKFMLTDKELAEYVIENIE